MPLFVADVEISVVIEAADQKAAERIAQRSIDDEVRDNGVGWPHVYALGKYIPDGWGDSIPYGSAGEETVRQIIARMEEEKRRAPPTIAELEAAGQRRLVEP